jgi:murein L,D-transpeptidase YcbB/YkuD
MISKINFPDRKTAIVHAVILITAISLLALGGCKRKRPELANALFKKTHNKVFRDFMTDDYVQVFKQVFAADSADIPNAVFIGSYYSKNAYKPVFTLGHLFNNDLLTAVNYYEKANEHGLNTQMFMADSLRAMISKFYDKNGIKDINEAYRDMAKLELFASGSLINYSNALQFGVVNPKKIYQRYFLETKLPDSSSMARVFDINDMTSYLDSLQPADPQYIALQKALADGYVAKGLSPEETRRILLVNLERLRWRNKPDEDKYVIVNIPDFTLNVIDKDSGGVVLKMNVCVGEGRNMKNENTVLNYNDTAKVDNPFPHETPLLNSMIHSVQVNPIWNIPNSIANKEIIVEAAKDRFYLSNKNIEVYKNDKLIKDPENINWSKVNKTNSGYEFKQKPGADNSLGKIKFLFKNKSSVYLHDTPVKWAFSKKMRAVSHGCVRLGNPQGLALNLFGEGDKYQLIATDMATDNPKPTTVYLPKKVPVYITYVTCWADELGNLQIRPDVYGLDIVLYENLKKYLN